MSNYKRSFYLCLLIGVMACSALVWYAHNLATTKERVQNQLKTVTDTLSIYKTKSGKNAASIRILEGSRKEILAITEKQDKRIYDLIKETKGLRTLTTHGVITRTDTTVRIDTLRLSTPTEPLYLAKHITNKWYNADIIVKNDSLSLKHISYNEFDYLLRDKPASGLFGFLKPTTYIVEAINLNPNTITQNLKTIEIKPKSKTGLKISMGVALGLGAILLLK